jgi:hypothetical protein
MAAQFNSESIFGTQTKITGPAQQYRSQREQLPGVSGFRVYRLGRGPWVWRIRGRMNRSTFDLLRTAIETAAAAYLNGQLYTFTDNGGATYANCLLSEYRPVSNPVRTDSGYTVELEATVEWASPS